MELKIKDVMNSHFQSCQINSTIFEALTILSKYRINIIPIENKAKKLVGIITKSKIIDALASGYVNSDTIEPLVNLQPISIHIDDKAHTVRDKLLNKKIGHTPVIDKHNHVLGLISTSQILYVYSRFVDIFESQLELLFNSLNFGLVSVDTNFKITTYNPIAKQILGITTNDGRQLNNERLKNMVEYVITNKVKAPKQKVSLNGASFVIECNPLFEKGRFIGTMIIMDDLTEIEKLVKELEMTKQWEEKLRTVIKFAYDAIILVDKEKNISITNKGFSDLTGYEENDLIGQPIEGVLPNIGVDDVFQSGKAITGISKLINEQQCLVTNLPIHNDGELIGVVSKITFKGLQDLRDALNKVSHIENKTTALERKDLKGTKYLLSDIIGTSSSTKKMKQEAYAAAKSNSTVLLIGESGTGKEILAHGIHAASQLSGDFIKVNCSAIPKELMESEFFGYEEGAFTGAKKGGKKGKLELAKNGTLFLDEIGDLPLELQPKLLRALQEKEFEKIGGEKSININIRIIAATNKNLEQMVQDGEFREDLYYRLNILRIDIPTLSERKDDIPMIVDNILERLNHSGFHLKDVSPQTMDVLFNYNWPGNIRELQNVLERAANFSKNGLIDNTTLPNYIFEHQESNIHVKENTDIRFHHEIENSDSEALNYEEILNNKDRALVIDALLRANGNKTKASELLGISRTWLYKKIRRYKIDL